MVPHMKALVFILILIFGSSFSGLADGFKHGTKLPDPNSSEDIQMMARKLIRVEAQLDYDDPQHNHAHTPPDNGGKEYGGKRKGGSVNN